MARKDEPRVVFSTDFGKHCGDCGKPTASCVCAQKRREAVLGDGVVRVRLEKQGRGGKTVSVIKGIPLNSDQLKQLGSELKKLCGTGGAVKDADIEIQGDHVEKLLVELCRRGFKAKKGGG